MDIALFRISWQIPQFHKLTPYPYHISFLTIPPHLQLSNDPGEEDSSFFCYAATVLSHIRIFSFLHRECINLHEGRLHHKMHLHSSLKGCFFFLLKDFDQSQELKTIAKKSLQFICSPHRISLLFKLRPDFMWKMVRK